MNRRVRAVMAAAGLLGLLAFSSIPGTAWAAPDPDLPARRRPPLSPSQLVSTAGSLTAIGDTLASNAEHASGPRDPATRSTFRNGSLPFAQAPQPPSGALVLAAKQGSIEKVRALLKQGARINQPAAGRLGSVPRTPLEAAAANGHAQILRLLLEHQASVASIDQAPVLLSAVKGRYATGGTVSWPPNERAARWQIVRDLVRAGAGVFETNLYGQSAISVVRHAWQTHEAHSRFAGTASSRGSLPPIDPNPGDLLDLLLTGAAPDECDLANNTPLHIAAASGRTGAVATLLTRKPPLAMTNRLGLSPIDLAAESARTIVIEQLLSAGAQPTVWSAAAADNTNALAELHARNPDIASLTNLAGDSPLRWAARAGQPSAVRWLLDHHAHVNHQAADGFTALHLAAAFGHADAAVELLRHGADLRLRDRDGATPLERATLRRQTNLVALLLEYHPPLDPDPVSGLNPIHRAVLSQAPPIIQRLAAAGADLNAQDTNGFTPLHLAAQDGNPECARTLLALGADPGRQDAAGRLALDLASTARNRAVVALLLEHTQAGADGTGGHATPLHLAALSGRTEDVQKLLDQGACLDARDEQGRTPFFLASEQAERWSSVPDLLLAAGADINATNNTGLTAIHSCVRDRDRLEVLRLRLPSEQAAEPEADLLSLLPAHSIVGCLLRRGANLNVPDGQGRTPLHTLVGNLGEYTARDHPIELLLRMFVRCGAKLEARDTNGFTALHLACQNSATPAARVLLALHADPNARDVRGRTPLHYAAGWEDQRKLGEHADLIDLLLTYGAEADAVDLDGETALHRAARRNARAAVQVLLERGANRAPTNHLGQTPLFLATSSSAPVFLWSASLLPEGVATDLFTAIRTGDIESLRTLLNTDPLLAQCQAWDGETPLHAALKHRTDSSGLLKVILNHQPDLTATNRSGWTPLYLAAWLGRQQAANLLADAGSPMSPDIAAMLGRTSWLASALDHTPDLVRSERNGWTLLHFAALHNQTEAARLLLDRGADPLAHDGLGNAPTPLQVALEHKQTETAALLRQRGADKDVWALASLNLWEALAQAVRVQPALLHYTNRSGWSLLHAATAKGAADTLTWLIDRGLSPTNHAPPTPDPVEIAVHWNQPRTLQLLLEHGGDPNHKDAQGSTLLHRAVEQTMSMGLVRVLLEHGADPAVVDQSGRTPAQRLQRRSAPDREIVLRMLAEEHWSPQRPIRTGRNGSED